MSVFEKKVEWVLQARRALGQRPLPAFVAGSKVNLALLLDKVKESGGYSKTSGSRKWGDVASSIGLPPHCGPSVKLVYLKYLKAFESGQVFGAGVAPANATKGNVDSNVKRPIHSHVKEALAHVRKLALDPGIVAHSEGENEKFQATIRGFLGRLHRQDNQQYRHQKRYENNRPRRPSKYSLRSLTPRPRLQPPTSEPESVPIGPSFQAEVPSSVPLNADNDDSKLFLGRVVWSKRAMRSHTTSMCFCTDDRSEDCVKQHVDEQRRKLKLELGEDVFQEWGFHTMGESLIKSGKWSRQEQAEFAEIVRSCRGDKEEKFWPDLQASFAGRRSREDLVSYYFNVYMLRKRALQNRTYAADSEKFDSDKEDDDLPGLVV
ncbi:hypothetical protein SELMODRAFT_425742 [Selaginella moellendorffii]|uniref:ARID domain-containing protein n=1 Tax=Selaginella moellendorffii TaxID=88036 RepID=D8SU51_SELML|nr:uncharacterized protein LOC9642059 [Selaginella moellendorffii]EFJ12006.1 hypothetical protein SELMODRAFT_425742 [Selaginella moellendorffii]|eukprot:XP_002986924.1 uncharacterized protein LOC9642059 [Selaginella moellendorffii]